MTYNDCITQYGTDNEQYCAAKFGTAGQTPFEMLGDFIGSALGDLRTWMVLVLVLILIFFSIKIIRHKTAGLVERFGRFNRVLQPGFHMIIPFVEKVVERVELRQYQIDVESVVKTKDEQMITLPITAIVQVNDPENSYYQVEKPNLTMGSLINNEVKVRASEMTLQEIYDDRESIKTAVDNHLSQKISDWGFTVKEVVIDNPDLTDDMIDAHNKIATAELDKRAAEAEGDAYKIRRDRIAEGSASALQKVIGDTGLSPEAAAQFFISVDTNDAVREAAKSGSTVVVSTATSGQAILGTSALAN